jgi:hypothetical protein
MLRTVRDACQLQDNILDFALGDQIEDLEALASASKTDAERFFAKNFVTKGMATLLRMGLARLGGTEGQAVFELRQAMGGGKTHSMLALGFLARFPELRYAVPEEVTRGLAWSSAEVVTISGRSIDRDRFLWGDIARQLGREDDWRRFWIKGPEAPNENDWRALFGDKPTLVLLDELPPYFDYAYTKAVGGGTLASVTTYALSNMLAAALKCPKVCIVVSNLSGSYENATKDLARAIGNFAQESARQAKGITPVELGSNEIYEILKKRLFKTLPATTAVDAVADAFGKALGEAIQAKSIAKSAEQIKDEIYASYPFHPALKSVIALFKENEKYRQTRGLMQFVARAIKSVWERPANDVYLIGAQHLDLDIADVREEVNRIAPSLQSAIAQDVAANGDAHAEQIDADMGSDAGSQVASLLLTASLSDSLDSVKGLSREQMMEILVAPNRSVAEFEDAFEKLKARSWYLHKKDNGVWYFSNLENLKKRIDSLAAKAPVGKVEEYVRKRLEEIFTPRKRNAYQRVLALPQIDQIKLGGNDRTCLVMSPDNRIPPEEARRFWNAIVEKNAICVVTGDSGTLTSLHDKAARVWAVEKVEAELEANGHLRHHAEEIENERGQALYDFHSAIVSMFNRVFFPGRDATKKDALLPTRLELTFGEDGFDGEAAVEKALSGTDASKLHLTIEGTEEMLIRMAEAMLWPANKEQRRIPWRDVQERAQATPRWVWLPPKSLDRLRVHAVSTGGWRYSEDGYVEKGPFPPPRTEVHLVDDIADHDRVTGAATLKVTARSAGPNGKVHYSTTPHVDASCPTVEDGVLTTTAAELWFLAIDPDGKHETGDVRHWANTLFITHQPHFVGGKRTLELKVVPGGMLRWNTDGTNPKEGKLYEGPIELPGAKEQPVWVHAKCGSVEKTEKFVIPASEKDGPVIDDAKPATLTKRVDAVGTQDVFQAISVLKKGEAKAAGVQIVVGDGDKVVRYAIGGGTTISAPDIEEMIAIGRRILGDSGADVEIRMARVSFGTGHDLIEFARQRGFNVTSGEVSQ